LVQAASPTGFEPALPP